MAWYRVEEPRVLWEVMAGVGGDRDTTHVRDDLQCRFAYSDFVNGIQQRI